MLTIIEFPHPTLRHVSKPLRRVDAELVGMVRDMFDLMYEKKGVGLAANQVDLPYRLFIANLESDPKRPDLEYVFINPVLSQRKGSEEAEEGCLSLPGLYGQVIRPQKVTLNAYSLEGKEIKGELSGLFARVAQHEVDHLDGVLFIDRLSPTSQMSVREAIEEFEIQHSQRLATGGIPGRSEIDARLAELEKLRC